MKATLLLVASDFTHRRRKKEQKIWRDLALGCAFTGKAQFIPMKNYTNPKGNSKNVIVISESWGAAMAFAGQSLSISADRSDCHTRGVARVARGQPAGGRRLSKRQHG